MAPQMKALIESYAKKTAVPLQLSVMPNGTTDVSSVHLVKEGILGAALTFPRRYSHSPVEMANLNDFEQGFRLLEAMLRDSSNWGELNFI